MTGSSAISALGEHLRSKPVIAFLALATHYVLHTFEWDTRFHLILYSWALGFGGIALITFMTGQHAGAIAATVQMTATVASLYFSVLFTSILLHRGFFHRLRKVCRRARNDPLFLISPLPFYLHRRCLD